MSNSKLKTALAFYEDDFESATARLRVKVEGIAYESSGDIEELGSRIDEILEESAKTLKPGFIVVSVEALEALRIPSSDPSDEIEDAFRDYDWEVRKALRELKAALVRSEVTA